MAEFQESTTIAFEWTIKGLRNLFESSRGDTKSRVTRSVRFGGGKWQILFYANSGEGNFVSLYLNCEPTQEEKDNATNSKWVRDGLFKFSFELRNTQKNTLFNMKEACDHTFSYKTQNWGWAQFAKRDAVYYGASAVRQSDSFVVICTITSSPSIPVNPPRIKKRAVPMAMLDVVGSLLDDPTYSDIEFVFPNKTTPGKTKGEPKKIWANKKLLTRADYFHAMFNSGFSENASLTFSSGRGVSSSIESDRDTLPSEDHLLDDSDLEDEAADTESIALGEANDDDEGLETEKYETPSDERPMQEDMTNATTIRQSHSASNEGAFVGNAQDIEGDTIFGDKRSMPYATAGTQTSPRSRRISTRRDESPEVVLVESHITQGYAQPVPGPPKLRVVVRDAAYATYRAVLYYLYTDSIIFAPLASSFLHKSKRHTRSQSQRVTADAPTDIPRDGEDSMSSTRPGLSRRSTQLPPGGEGMVLVTTASSGATTRGQWIKAWEIENPGRPLPCSAKAVFRLADKLDLAELKERAREHIVKSLTVTNIPHEVFSSFSATFEDIRRVQIDYFLANWGEIRGSEAMSGVWQQIRNGRHPGFEEVWPLIAQNLEYRTTQAEGAAGDGEREGVAGE
ncbi:hypothetical protein FRC19_006709 [Serendipita sp. 401]|nr:hypothetical protein FRC19_006709 [Serendipita sp. 401]KAG8835445.1 hypothetical protein FRC18_000477 [Serendipita sp. 400]